MRKACLSLVVLICCGCAEPGRTSLVGSAAGGIMGAGLGAVVGNQVGSAGSGLLIGAVAGTSAGAAIGSTLEEQEQIARTQDEAIERHERTIQAQRSELIELRRMNQDDTAGERRSASLRAAFAPSLDLKPKADIADRDLNIRQPNQDILRGAASSVDSGAHAPSMAARLPRPESVGSRWDVGNSQTASAGDVQASRAAEPAALDQCSKAEQEIRKSEEVSDSSDKLFHLRRAIRLCPEQPRYRLALGDYYAANNKSAEAKAEYERANKLAPDTVVVSERLKQFSNY